MKQVTPFVISEFTNPSGKIVFQLYARIDGKRFRPNFPTRAEAEAERQILGLQYLQETEMRVAATRAIRWLQPDPSPTDSLNHRSHCDSRWIRSRSACFGTLTPG